MFYERLKTTSGVEFAPTSGNMGPEVLGIDLTDAHSDDLVEEMKRQLGNYGLLVFRDQDVAEEQQIAFAHRFGDTVGHPVPGIGGGDTEWCNLADAYDALDEERIMVFQSFAE